MENLDITLITRRSIRGVLALVSRTFIMQIITFVAGFLLTILLDPSVFGVFFVVSAAIAFLSYFSDIGLAAALIQKKENITEEDLKTTFTIQQILVVGVVTIVLFFSKDIGSFYNLDKQGVVLLQALAIGFFLSSLKTIPSVILERSLKFERLVIPQIVETIFFNVTASTLAFLGVGITSFTFAVLARGVSGLIAIYIISPWRIRFGFYKESAKKLLSFGIPFQFNSFLALVKDDLLVVYLGKVLPLNQVGFIGFAQKWAFTPLRLIMDNVIRITFPSFSRLQDEKKVLTKAIEKSIFAASFFIFPSLLGLVILAPYFIEIIPRYSKWEPSILSLTFFAINAVFSSVSTPLTNALNAIGKIKTTLYLMIFWTVCTWVLTPLAVFYFGFNAVAAVSALISTSAFLVVFIVRRHIKFNFLRAIIYPLISSLVMGVAIYSLGVEFVKDIWSLILVIAGGAILYFTVIFLLAKKNIVSDISLIKANILNK